MENNVEIIDDMLNGVEKMMGEQLKPMEGTESPIAFEEPKFEEVKVETPVVDTKVSKDSDLNSIFDSLSNDIAGANNFMSTLMEQKKNVNLTESYLAEQKDN